MEHDITIIHSHFSIPSVTPSETWGVFRWEGIKVGAISNALLPRKLSGMGYAFKEYLLNEFCLGSDPTLMLFLALVLGKSPHLLIATPCNDSFKWLCISDLIQDKQKTCWSYNVRISALPVLQLWTSYLTFLNFLFLIWKVCLTIPAPIYLLRFLGGTNEMAYVKARCIQQSLYIHIKHCMYIIIYILP